jgi:hypothetical protein
MSETDRDDSSRYPRLEEVLAEYLRRVASGETMDRERFLTEHADVAADLRQYFETADMVERLAAPAARLDDAVINRDAATLPPSSLVSDSPAASDATPDLSTPTSDHSPLTTHRPSISNPRSLAAAGGE